MSLIFSTNNSPSSLYSFQNATFTTGGITGINGPTLAQAIAGVSGTPTPSTWTGTYLQMKSYQGIQQWTVPKNGTYTITCAGAGGSGNLGSGAIITANFTLSKGDIINIVCGQPGGTDNGYNNGGCGGSFVFTSSTLLIASGGASGSRTYYGGANPAANASLTINGNGGLDAGYGHFAPGDGGIGPNGGSGSLGGDPTTAYTQPSANGMSGSPGIAGNGGTTSSSVYVTGSGGGGGWSITSTFIGGNAGSSPTHTGLVGGFGLGGGTGATDYDLVPIYNTNYANGIGIGGGGGYGGGGGGIPLDPGLRPASGGGGGSYCIVTPLSSSVTNSSAGYVTITYSGNATFITNPLLISSTTISPYCILSLAPPNILYTFQNATFTTGGLRGQYGPTLAQAITGLSGTPSPSTWTGSYFTMNSYQGIQQWTVPQSGIYTITCAGAGTDVMDSGIGYGAVFTATFNLTVGQIVSIVCGQKVKTGNHVYYSYGIGGSGGSFVFINNTLLMASGGGSCGAPLGLPDNPPVSSASLTTTGVSKSGAGGVGPNGGGGGAGYSGGPAGYSGVSGIAGDGGPGSLSTNAMGGGGGGGGWSATSSFVGGSYGSNVAQYSGYSAALSGGFGLGGGVGGYGTTNWAMATGGGGGYGGGGGGTAYNTGGGGGSYCAVTPISATLTNSSSGYVTITNNNSTTPISLVSPYCILTRRISPVSPLWQSLSISAVNSAVAIYSLRALTAQSKLVITVQNGTTSATSDFYADPSGVLTTGANNSGQTLSSWLSGATGYITTWYDQSGNGLHMSQPTLAKMPTVDTSTTPYSVKFNGTSTWMYNPSCTFNFGGGSFTVRYAVSNNVGGCVLFKAIDTNFTWYTPDEKVFWLGDGAYATESSRGNYPAQVGNSEGFQISTTAIPSSTTSRVSIVHKAVAVDSVPIYINTVQTTLSPESGTYMQNDAGNYLIIGKGGIAVYYQGNIFEVEIFSIPLSDTDRITLDN